MSTTNLALNQPAYNSSAWNTPLNANETILDNQMAGTTSLTLTSLSTLTLTGPATDGTGQTQAMRIVLTGVLSSNVTVYIPSGISGRWIVYNTTSGTYTVTFANATSGGATVVVPQGANTSIYCALNQVTGYYDVRLADDGVLGGSPTFTNITVTGTINGSTISTGGALAVTGNITPTGRITPRVSVTSSPSSPFSWNSNNYDEFVLNSISNALTINVDSGTPVQGQTIIFRLKDNGSSQTLTWTQTGAGSFRQIGAFLPTSTTASKISYVGAIYNSTDSYWDVVAVTTQT